MRKRGSEESARTQTQGEWVELARVRHCITFREITLRPFVTLVRELRVTDGARVVALEQVERMAVSSATRKIARAARMAWVEKARRIGAARR